MNFSSVVANPTSLYEYLTPKEENASKKKKKEATISSKDVPEDKKVSLLSDFFAASAPVQSSTGKSTEATTNISCLNSISFSGWNPPPKYRKLAGDLVYLTVSTLENRTLHITGSSKGFYVNSSSNATFNPTISDKDKSIGTCYTLVGLLNQLSPLFKKNFQKVLHEAFSRHPFEMFPVPVPIHSWVGKKEKHTVDLNRSEESLNVTPDPEFRGLLRDWNEEYQTCKELPKETIQERIVRDRALFKVNADFVEAAVKGASLIVDKSIPPINPLDNEKSFMYIYNNIFFSYAMDGRDLYKEYGGDKAAYVSVNNDLKGVKLLNKADVKGLYTLATAIIDYRGHRVVAQSIIPGILQREQTSNVVYGSIDNGENINSDNTFHDLLVSASKSLHLKEHKVTDASGKSVTLVTPVESKGIIGTDTRKYILDLVRLTPRDANYDGKENLLTVIRPELISAYLEHLRQQELLKRRQEKEKLKKEQQQQESTTTTDTTSTASSEGKKEEEVVENKSSEEGKKEEETPAVGEETKEEIEEEMEEEIEIKFGGFNPNVMCGYKVSEEEVEGDTALVKEISTFLKETMIPIFIEDLAWITPLPLDGETLTKSLHSHGINIRYLGHIAKVADKIHILKELVLREMITRSAKHIFRSIIRDTKDHKLSIVITNLLNCLLGNIKSSLKEDKKNKYSTQSIWEQIVKETKDRFNYELPTSRDSYLNGIIRNIPTLRSICTKVGIKVESRDFEFSMDSPFLVEDILELYPVVKHTDPQSYDGSNLLEAGKSFLSQGRLDIAYELLTQALAIFHQVYGPMHKDTAACYGHLSTVLYHAKDLTQSLDNQEKSTIINERVEGLDKYDTIHSYLNLALLSHSMGKHKAALQYVHHALYLTRLVGGKNHPDSATVYINIASMLQEQQLHKSAIDYYQEALAIYESLIGTNNLQTAAIYHAIAIAYSQIGAFKEALVYEKKNYTILHEKVGDEDIRTVESNICLKQFTSKAVQMQIETKKAQRDITSQLSQVKLDKLRTTTGAISIPQPGKSTSTGPMGTRPLNEVLAFINGGNKNAKKSFSERNSKTKKQGKQIMKQAYL